MIESLRSTKQMSVVKYFGSSRDRLKTNYYSHKIPLINVLDASSVLISRSLDCGIVSASVGLSSFSDTFPYYKNFSSTCDFTEKTHSLNSFYAKRKIV